MRKLGAVAIVVVGALAIVQALAMAEYSLMSRAQGGWIDFVAALLPTLILLGLGIVLVVYRGRIAASLFEDSPLDVSLDAQPLLRIGLILVGVTLITNAIPVLAAVIPFVLVQNSQSGEIMGEPLSIGFLLLESVPSALIHSLELAFGVVLIVRSHSLASRLWRVREPVTKQRPVKPVLPTCPACGSPFDPSEYRDPTFARCSACGGQLEIGSV